MKATQENSSPNIAPTDIWSFTTAFIQVVRSQNMDVFAELLSGIREEERNEYVTFYTADPITLPSGERLRAISISENRYRKRIGAGFEISNRCISRDEVKQHYPGWRVVEAPRGGSLEEQTLFQVDVDGYAYTFGFAEKAPDCLNSISVGRLRKH
ncbi:hypothetical protein [Trinickia mobilis]|uniref:hypothetical protein n=1 Tax=Trinickia mobilis TaxID=2816356 RepID=UPI001A8C7E30|nr:hypothetical protein [Trinickia mobilis]